MVLVVMLLSIYKTFVPPPTETPELTASARETLAATGVIIDVASSNTKQNWINAVAEQFNADGHTTSAGRQIFVQVSHVLSGGSQQAILSGTLQPTVWSPGEYSWVEGANQVWQDRTGHALVSEHCLPTANAPSGLAMWRPMAEALGWPDTPIGWGDLLALANADDGWGSVGHPEWGAFQFGHVHPDFSNVGLLLLSSLAYHAAGKTAGLQVTDVYSDPAQTAFRQLELKTYHYGLQSRDLLDLMVNRGPSYLHAVTTSEAETLRTNAERGDRLRFPLAFIFLSDGTFWSEHPYCILSEAEWVSDEQQDAARIFRDYLLSPSQQDIAVNYYIRPVNQQSPLHAPIALEYGTDPRVTQATSPALESPSADVANAVRDVFHMTKKPAAVLLILDTSGSMGGDLITNAVASAQNFIRRMSARDEVYVLGFSTTPVWIGQGGLISEVGETIVQNVGGLYADGGTALHDAMCMAVATIEDVRARHDAAGEPHLYGIVLLSDGGDTSSTITENQMFEMCLPDGENADGVKVFTISYGQYADQDLMTRIARRTNGKPFQGGPDNIEQIYSAISAEQ
ncbi:MAG: VWA domain-containing protein [Anaerolineae bacterium]|nr:VWA domain-containing protein [Anaerolineae bacterium]